jgi:predicted ATP-dependent endonuclease of OLD family
MKLSKLNIKHFRCYSDETIHFGDYTCVVGAGGAGKSTILTALRILFRDATESTTDLFNLHREDFHKKDITTDIAITATFTNLDAEAQEEFKHYFRHGELVVSAVAKWDEKNQSAEVKQYGERLGIPEFKDFFEHFDDKAAAVLPRYDALREKYSSLPAAKQKPAMEAALHAFESEHPEQLKLIASSEEFYGFTRGANKLRKYVEWVFIPAVKDASTEQVEGKKTALGQLLERTVRSKISFTDKLSQLLSETRQKYGSILEENQNALTTLSESLSGRLKEWAHPNASLILNWKNDSSRQVSIADPLAEVLAGEGRFQGPLSRFGHGLQRCFLLALLQELSGCKDSGNPRLILACEEPELYQHPPQARYMSTVLQNLSEENSQVIITTHSPYFISGRGFEDVRVVRQELLNEQPSIRHAEFDVLSRRLGEVRNDNRPAPRGMQFKVEQALQPTLNEIFFSPVVILVEGLEDVAYLSTYFLISNRMDEFRRLGCHIVATSGKSSMLSPLVITGLLGIPTFVIFDADGHERREDKRAQHARDNTALMRACGLEAPDPFPAVVFTSSSLVVWPTEIGAVVKESLTNEAWRRCEDEVRQANGLQGVDGLEKNSLFIGSVLAKIYDEGRRSAILEELCNQILSFARGVASSRATNTNSTAE